MNTPAVEKKGHPKGLYLLFTVEMWERMSYYGMRALLTLYMVEKTTAKNAGLGWSVSDALSLYGTYTALVYGTPIIGGFLADRFIGKRRAVYIGGVTMMVGHFLMAVPGMWAFYGALGCLIVGNGFFKPNISTMVGGLYDEGDPRRDSAFTIFYMGINLGAVLGGVVCGTLGEGVGFHWGFGAAGVGMLVGLVTFAMLENKLIPPHIGNKPEPRSASDAAAEKTPLTRQEVDRLAVILILAIFSMFFWAAFEQAGGLMNIYTYQKVDRTFLGMEVPASAFQSVNPAIIFIFAPLFSMLWGFLGRRGIDPPTPVKMGFGLLLLSFGFVFMLHAVNEADAGFTGKAALLWVIGAYFWHTMGELCLSPIGLSMVTKLAPAKIVSLMMGVWFGSNFVANYLAGIIGGYSERLGEFPLFTFIIFGTAGAGMLLFLVSRPLVRMMHLDTTEKPWGMGGILVTCAAFGLLLFGYPKFLEGKRDDPSFQCKWDQREAKHNLYRAADKMRAYKDEPPKEGEEPRGVYPMSLKKAGFYPEPDRIDHTQRAAIDALKKLRDKAKELYEASAESDSGRKYPASLKELELDEKVGEYKLSYETTGTGYSATAQRVGAPTGDDGRDLAGDTWKVSEDGVVRNLTHILYRYRLITQEKDAFVIEAKRKPDTAGLEGDTWTLDEGGSLRNITGGCGNHKVPPPETPPANESGAEDGAGDAGAETAPTDGGPAAAGADGGASDDDAPAPMPGGDPAKDAKVGEKMVPKEEPKPDLEENAVP